MKITADLPKIDCPVYGVLKMYSLAVAEERDSTELKYVLLGVWNNTPESQEVTVHGIYVDANEPYYIKILYTVNGGDGIMQITRANIIKPLPKKSEKKEDDTLRALHHGNMLFIRMPKVKTFRFMAQGLSKVIRGNSSYIVYNVRKEDDLLWFKVAEESKPTDMFDISASKISAGEWHCEKGKMCPVPGPAPEDK
jgi:hypothetical protein